jgi:hypothetical protein
MADGADEQGRRLEERHGGGGWQDGQRLYAGYSCLFVFMGLLRENFS